MTLPGNLIKLTGDWNGINRLWLYPGDPERRSDTTATISVAGSQGFFVLSYTWAEDGPQDGLLLIQAAADNRTLTAAWIDSWHNGERIMPLSGELTPDGNVSLLGSYPIEYPDWKWRIAIVSGDEHSLKLIMYNIPPDGQEVLAVEASYQR